MYMHTAYLENRLMVWAFSNPTFEHDHPTNNQCTHYTCKHLLLDKQVIEGVGKSERMRERKRGGRKGGREEEGRREPTNKYNYDNIV